MPPEPPSKFIREEVTLDLRASIEYVDMDGMHDGQAIKTIIADLQPRKLVSLCVERKDELTSGASQVEQGID